MALALTFRIALSSDAKTLTITDRTGAYSGLQTGGFGSPNPAVSDATSATIKIAKRNSDGTFAAEITVNVFNALPSDSAGTYDISATTGVNADTYTDGIYRFIFHDFRNGHMNVIFLILLYDFKIINFSII